MSTITQTNSRTVDHSGIRTHQTVLIALLALAFVLNAPILVGINALVLLLTALVPPLAPYTSLYRHVLRPAGIVKPDVQVDNPEPHRFAALVGGICLSLSVIALVAGAALVGWGLVVLVIALASLNLFAGWCAGCMMYYWLNKLGVPGFDRAPVKA